MEKANDNFNLQQVISQSILGWLKKIKRKNIKTKNIARRKKRTLNPQSKKCQKNHTSKKHMITIVLPLFKIFKISEIIKKIISISLAWLRLAKHS